MVIISSAQAVCPAKIRQTEMSIFAANRLSKRILIKVSVRQQKLSADRMPAYDTKEAFKDQVT